MIRRPPRSTPLYSSAASDVYKRQMVSNPRTGFFSMATKSRRNPWIFIFILFLMCQRRRKTSQYTEANREKIFCADSLLSIINEQKLFLLQSHGLFSPLSYPLAQLVRAKQTKRRRSFCPTSQNFRIRKIPFQGGDAKKGDRNRNKRWPRFHALRPQSWIAYLTTTLRPLTMYTPLSLIHI